MKDIDKLLKGVVGTNQQLQKVAEMVSAPIIPPLPDFGKQIHEQQRRQTAVWSCEKLAEEIREFEVKLDQQHEVGAYLASFGSTMLLHLRSVRSIQPNLIAFDGITDNKESATLVQNMNQMNVLLVAVKKLSSEPFRIGFVHVDDLAAEAARK